MWNEYYRLTTELVKGVAAPLPTNHPFYVLLESSGSDAERIRSDLEDMLEHALEQDIILGCDDCKLGRGGRGDLENPRLLGRARRARSARTASASTSASPSTGWRRSPTPSRPR